jgi:mannose-6-phosphate isomerase-like protein (cupin superfamily)
MQRRDFLQTGALASMFLMASGSMGHQVNPTSFDTPKPLEPVLLPALPPLDHNGGLSIRTWVRSEMTGGIYSSVECAVAPKTMGPPPHYHKELDELMLVLEGTAHVLVGNDVVEIKAGGWHLRPRLIKHTFWNAGDSSLRFVDMYFNQAFEQYLERIFLELTEKNGFPEGSAAKNQELNTLNEKFGVVFLENAFSEFDELKKRYGLK